MRNVFRELRELQKSIVHNSRQLANQPACEFELISRVQLSIIIHQPYVKTCAWCWVPTNRKCVTTLKTINVV